MLRISLPLLAVVGAAAVAFAGGSAAAQAQDTPVGRCTTPDSVAIRGNSRVTDETIRGDAGLAAGAELNYRIVQRAIKTLYATSQFDDVKVLCETGLGAGKKTTLIIDVRERPVVMNVSVVGANRVSAKSVRDKIEISTGKAVDPALVAHAVSRIDSLYENAGYYLAKVKPETTLTKNEMKLTFRIEEGRRLAVSGVRVNGNRAVKAAEIVAAMKTKPEGFWFWKKGGYDDDKFAGDIGERIPELYAKRGYIDFLVERDTLMVDKERGKALVDITVKEGPKYKVGSFEVAGNRRFSSDEVQSFYPFTKDNSGPAAFSVGRVTDFLRGKKRQPYDVFDRTRWDDARNKFQTAYANEGYIYATVRPVVERKTTADSTQHYVDLRWEIDEKSPAIVNRIEIAGNDYTTESCIRDQLQLVPGDVFNQERLIRSYQNIGNLGFFESPLPPPDTHTTNEQGDVDIVFNVKEKRTGNVNFGASLGQGTGVGGFIGLDQPNLFGQCKRGSLQWQYGRYINDFNLTYSDPRIRQSRVTGTVTAYRTLSRYNIADLGRSLRTGGNVQFGLPVFNSYYTRLFVSYGGENVKFGTTGLLGETRSVFGSGFRSTLGFTTTRDTRFGLPFATGGSMQTISAQFNGGPLGGSAAFQKYETEARTYVPIGQLGSGGLGAQPIQFVLGLTSRAGIVAGNTGPFFYSQEFAMGGVQFGQQLRGYDEFSISPHGYITGTSTFNAQRTSFGKAFFSSTAELGMRVNQALYIDAFYDAGNLYAHARDFDPTRLFRGAGIGTSVVTPLGPLGLDYAYGFDRLDTLGRPAPKWQLHFRLGQLF